MIVSTTLAGPGAENTIADALRSCIGLANVHLVVFSGADPEKTIPVIDSVLGTRQDGGWVSSELEWSGHYGDARNAALQLAELVAGSRGEGSWALTLDCDERLEIPGFDFEATDFTGVDCLTVIERDLQYQKPRYIRLGNGAHWVGPCSERLVVKGRKAIIPGQFWELPKTPEQERARMERGIEKMPAMIKAEPGEHQWRRHYAECLIGVGRLDEGMQQHFEISLDPEMDVNALAWSNYRLAEQEILRERYQPAFNRCAYWLARCPGFIQEFGWLLAHLHAKAKQHQEAITWAEYALNAPIDDTRGGHRSPTWRAGCEALLASARPAAPAQEPVTWSEKDFQRREAFQSDYETVVRALRLTLPFSSHLDLGAGNGLLVAAMRKGGHHSMGVEANPAALGAMPKELQERISIAPLEQWGQADSPYDQLHDLVSCVEVAEHIPETQADELVAHCCARSTRWVYFSAAPPGQGGHGHINEQPPSYWLSKFAARGFVLQADETDAFRARLADIKTCWWLRRNALLLRLETQQ
jgi:hypothetical protein